jgi:hypothetical protein
MSHPSHGHPGINQLTFWQILLYFNLKIAYQIFFPSIRSYSSEFFAQKLLEIWA